MMAPPKERMGGTLLQRREDTTPIIDILLGINAAHHMGVCHDVPFCGVCDKC